MKAKIILANWMLSLCILVCTNTEYTKFWAVMLIFGWFCASSILFIYADRKGWMKGIKNRLF